MKGDSIANGPRKPYDKLAAPGIEPESIWTMMHGRRPE